MQQLDEQQEKAFREWTTRQHDEIADYCFRQGLIRGKISVEAQWVLPGHIMLATIRGRNDSEPQFWVVATQIETAHAGYSVAADARAALRHFGMNWHLQAARVEAKQEEDREAGRAGKIDWAEKVRPKAELAEIVLQLVEDDRYWEPVG